MRLCSDHFEDLKLAIKSVGLLGFAASSTTEAMRRVHREAFAGVRAETFDPVMGAITAVYRNAINGAPREFFERDRDAKDLLCPLCQMKSEVGKEKVDYWLSRAANEQKATAKALGLLTKAAS